MNHYKNVVIFGGSGFIGAHFSIYFLDNNLAEKIVLADVEPPKYQNLPKRLKQLVDEGKINFIQADVRNALTDNTSLPKQVDLIVNLAAVHREPGHEKFEYYDTNIPGAENVCNWARQINCQQIVFTSSIAVYGTEKIGPKTEATKPEPNSPYGVSKLAAEKINEDWVKESTERSLLIVRPGVIFGTGEAGNITRMIRGIRGRYFVFLGNQNIIKSGGYVKELCRSLAWMLDWQKQQNQQELIYNFTFHPAATVAEYANSIIQAMGRKQKVWNIPYNLLLPVATVIGAVSNFVGIEQPVNAARVKKLLRENNIIAQKLIDTGYQYKYTLNQALADWSQEHPEDWR